MKRKTYRAPTTDAGRVAEARAAIRSLQATLNVGDNRFGSYGRNVRDSIARHQAVIDAIENPHGYDRGAQSFTADCEG